MSIHREKIFNFIIVVAFILLAFFMNSCLGVYDPGWLYMLYRPSLDRIEYKIGYGYIYKNDSLNIRLIARDFAFDTDVVLKITTTLDSIIIYPNFAYIESPHFVNKAHAPDVVGVKFFSDDSLIFKRLYTISETKGGKPFGVVSLEAWQENSINIDDRIKRKKIGKDEFSSPYCLHNGDSLLVNFGYRGFVIYSYNNNRNVKLALEKSDFILHYDIYNRNEPLTFYFKPATYNTEE